MGAPFNTVHDAKPWKSRIKCFIGEGAGVCKADCAAAFGGEEQQGAGVPQRPRPASASGKRVWLG